jgi:hypothetical protein
MLYTPRSIGEGSRDVRGGDASHNNHEALRAMLRIGGSEGRTLISVDELAAALDLNEHDAAELVERLASLGLVWVVRGSKRVGARGGLSPMAAVMSDAGRFALDA